VAAADSTAIIRTSLAFGLKTEFALALKQVDKILEIEKVDDFVVFDNRIGDFISSQQELVTNSGKPSNENQNSQ